MAVAFPPELAAVEDKWASPGAAVELKTVCGRHGPQEGPNCPSCDKFFPDQVTARTITAAAAAGVPAGFVALSEVKKMIREALDEERAFNAWKAQEQAAADAAAKAAADAKALEEQKPPIA